MLFWLVHILSNNRNNKLQHLKAGQNATKGKVFLQRKFNKEKSIFHLQITWHKFLRDAWKAVKKNPIVSLSMIEKENTINGCCYDPLHYPGFLTFTACHITCSAPLIKIKLFTYDMLHLSPPVHSLIPGLFCCVHSPDLFLHSGWSFCGYFFFFLLKLSLFVCFAPVVFLYFPFGLKTLDFKCL